MVKKRPGFGRLDERGVLQIPLALSLAILVVAGTATWGLLHRWRQLTTLQLRLDECVGRTAAAMTDDLRAIESSISRMRSLRTSIALMPEPRVKAALKAALQAEWLRQATLFVRWRGRQGLWLLKRGCDGRGDLPVPLPELPYLRDPPDHLGPRPPRWPEGRRRVLTVRLQHSPRRAAARIEGPDERRRPVNANRQLTSRAWEARWTSPD